MSCYVAIGIIVTIFVFPETMNHAMLGSISDLLGKINTFIDLQNSVLESRPEDIAPGTPLLTKILGTRAAIVGGFQQSKWLCVRNSISELSFCQWRELLSLLRLSSVMGGGMVMTSKVLKSLSLVSSVVSVGVHQYL